MLSAFYLCRWNFYLMSFSLLVTQPFSHASDSCPIKCTCKWKNGKQTAECIGMSLAEIPEGLSKETQVLDLTSNLLQALPTKAFHKAGLVNLQKVYLSRCGLLTVAADAFHQLSNLVELDLSNNFLRWIPSVALRDTPHLRRLLLNFNPIQAIENQTFTSLVKLTVLELSNCQLENIEPAAFDGLRKLEYLKLDNNKLRSVPPEIVKPFSTLYALDLHQNPWNCDCHIRSVRVWMKRHNVPISSPPQCTDPPRMRGKSWEEVGIDDFACKPEVTAVDPYVMATEGENATLGCRVHATPEPTLNWIWRGRVINNLTLMSFGRQMYLIREVGTTHKVSSLTIFNVMLKDSGRYLCNASNPAGHLSANISLDVSPKEDSKNSLSGEEIAGIVIGVLFIVFALLFFLSFYVVRQQRFFDEEGKRKGFSMYFLNLNHNHVDSAVKSTVVVDGNAIGSVGDETLSDGGGRSAGKSSPTSHGSSSQISNFGVNKVNHVIAMEQYNIRDTCKVRSDDSTAEDKNFRSLSRHSIRETARGIEMCALTPADTECCDVKDAKSWTSPRDESVQYVEGEKTEYIRKISDDSDDDDEEDSNAIVYNESNPANGAFFLENDVPTLKCSIWPLSEGSFKDESYHSYSSPSQSSWKRSSIAMPQQIHHIFSPDARDSPDEGLGDEREYETDILD